MTINQAFKKIPETHNWIGRDRDYKWHAFVGEPITVNGKFVDSAGPYKIPVNLRIEYTGNWMESLFDREGKY